MLDDSHRGDPVDDMSNALPLSPTERRELMEIACDTARQAGVLVREGFKLSNRGGIAHKGAIDLVTETDQRSEALIRELLGQRASIPVMGEEQGLVGELADTLWVVDPIDGTTNFVHGLPYFAVSIGVWSGGRAVCGAVYHVMADEMFATDGDTAWLNEHALPAAADVPLEQALLVSGFSYDRRTNPDNNFELWEAFVMKCRGGRRLGAAALDLVHVASGRLNGYWEANLKPWDFCAGAAIAAAAGCTVTTYSGAALQLRNSTMLCAPPALHAEMREFIAAHRRYPLYD